MGKINTAVILVAGMGKRLYEITNDEIPKGFICINEKTLIERSISKLRQAGIKKIYLVTGHLGNFYDKLCEKEVDLYVKRNDKYITTGSMASLATLKNLIVDDFLLLEGDLIYEIKALKDAIEYASDDCVIISNLTNSGDECYIEIKNNNLYKISKIKEEIKNIYGELVGISKISLNLYREMIKQFNKSKMQKCDYEYILFDVAKMRKIGYLKIENLIWSEIDNKEHLKRVKEYIIPRLYVNGEE
ncbi:MULTISPECIES: phosphocholine cytidylyltransferase family protein [Clostridium]|uniref:Phosphocholine cytidylyltransferase family protein n=1 Tax=Clostridium aquiflavi TaxID=3073603 RepID=A0ABU1EF08_9CLOT|nr:MULTISPECIES: phosphocholine cytidylyltransferase family protein [unclassified Clostridium]MDR5586968.1 phosphocholine cytidylyltransferase family protein [Clostridium sp. 5N-1]NFG60433.1 phosphocholine cytidylyltransferase family protein [Clostridium botulinum]NFQ09924.1 phosphocholine cytidylyltransferase family protein [Clostridium botulinum]